MLDTSECTFEYSNVNMGELFQASINEIIFMAGVVLTNYPEIYIKINVVYFIKQKETIKDNLGYRSYKQMNREKMDFVIIQISRNFKYSILLSLTSLSKES